MIPQKEIRALADLKVDGKRECALSFYFQPPMPTDKSRRQDGIMAKDIIRKIEREITRNRNNGEILADLSRIRQIAEDLHGNHGRSKVIFACKSRNIWREFDLPANLPASEVMASHRFHLKPLIMMLGTQPQSRIVVLDRKCARLFDLRDDEIYEREGLFHPISRRGRSDGWHGYDGGHSERSAHDEVLHHFRDVSAHLKKEAEQGMWEKWMVGCLESNWRDFEAQWHPELRERFIGRFQATPEITEKQVRDLAAAVFRSTQALHTRELIKRVLSYAKSHKRGVTGLRRVLRSLELGEVRALLVAENYSAHGVECTACGRLDAHMVRYCALCGHSTRKLEDIVDAMVPMIVQRDIELVCVRNQELEQVGNIAALLRFRSMGTNTPLAEAS